MWHALGGAVELVRNRVACGLAACAFRQELKIYVVALTSSTCDRRSAIQVASHRRRRLDGNEDLL